MTTERINVKASDLQIGDRVYRGPFRGSLGLENERIMRLSPTIEANGNIFSPDTEFIVDRPVPTVTVELPERVARYYASGGSGVASFEPDPQRSVRDACAAALGSPAPPPWGSEVSTEQAPLARLTPGTRVRRTARNFTDRRARIENRDGGTGWAYEPGAIGTLRRFNSYGQACVAVDGDTTDYRTWRTGSYEVFAPELRIGAKVHRTGFEDLKRGRFGVGTVSEMGSPWGNGVTVVGPDGVQSTWDLRNFEVVG